MQARPRLLHAWTAQVRALLPTLRATRAATLATFALGILWAGNVTLLKVAAALPLGVCDPSTERRLRRFVANPGVVVQEIWPALLPELLAGRRGDLRFVFDPTPYRDRATVLVVGLVQRRRVLPVAWRVTAQQTTWDETMPDLLGAMLAEVNAALPPACQAPQGRMTLLCDRGLVGVGIVDACQAAGWDLVLRLRSSAGDATMAVLPDGTETGVAALAAARVSGPGQRWHGPVQLLKGAGWRAGHLTVSWGRGESEPWVLFSTRAGGAARVRDYRRRADAEATYEDCKTRGFDLERSKLTARDRIDRLLLALHLALWWGQQLGLRAIRTGQRRRFDRTDRRDLSVARLGRRLFLAYLDADRCPPLPFHRGPAGLRYTWLG